MAAITQNCKEAAAGARLLGEIKQTKEKLWKYQHLGGGQKLKMETILGESKQKFPQCDIKIYAFLTKHK